MLFVAVFAAVASIIAIVVAAYALGRLERLERRVAALETQPAAEKPVDRKSPAANWNPEEDKAQVVDPERAAAARLRPTQKLPLMELRENPPGKKR
jgi:hypothetical protein